MDPVHDRGSMDPVHESGPWTRSKVGSHGPVVHVLSLPDANGYVLAKPQSKKPREETLDYIKNYNILSIYATNVSNLKYYKTKSGSGIVYFNNPHQLIDRLELLGGLILAGNNGVIPEFSQIAHLLNQMKVISKKQLNDFLKNYISIR